VSFCRLCGAGFQFVGDHKPGCEAVTPQPDGTQLRPFDARPTQATRDAMLAPAATEMPEGHTMRDRLVDAFNCADGYWFSRHDVDAILRALATQGLTIVDAKDRAVLEAWSFVAESVQASARGEAELARREKP
jgi:hypothetical protein